MFSKELKCNHCKKVIRSKNDLLIGVYHRGGISCIHKKCRKKFISIDSYYEIDKLNKAINWDFFGHTFYIMLCTVLFVGTFTKVGLAVHIIIAFFIGLLFLILWRDIITIRKIKKLP